MWYGFLKKPRMNVMLWAITFLLIFLVFEHDGGFASASEETTLNEIIANVEKNEVLYENLEVIMRENYDIGDRPSQTVGNSDRKEIVRVDVRTRHVTQGSLFRVEAEGSAFTNDSHTSRDRIRAFDGETTRVLDQNRIGNIITGRSIDENIIHPHMLLLRFLNMVVPLSTYLRGDDAVRVADPNCDWPADKTVVAKYVGEEMFKDLLCHRIQIVESFNNEPYNSWELLLAEDRNYLPVQMLAFTFGVSKTIPVGEGNIDDWQEVESGIWFPMSANIVSYNKDYILKEGRQQPQWMQNYITEEVSLNPEYAQAFFKEVVFPDNTGVYEIVDGRVIRKYRVGAPAPSERRSLSSVSSHWLLIIVINLVIFAAITAVVLTRKLRKKK